MKSPDRKKQMLIGSAFLNVFSKSISNFNKPDLLDEEVTGDFLLNPIVIDEK